MSLKRRLETDLKEAMKSRQPERVQCIRMLKAKIQEREVALRSKHGTDYEIVDDEAEKVVQTYAKQRRESIESYLAGGREELAASERAELEIVSGYLPEQLDEEQVRAAVAAAIDAAGATSPADLGKVMQAAMASLKGAADGKLVNRIARELLTKSPPGG